MDFPSQNDKYNNIHLVILRFSFLKKRTFSYQRFQYPTLLSLIYVETHIEVNNNATFVFRELLSKNCKESNNAGFKVQDYIREQTQKNTCVPCGT